MFASGPANNAYLDLFGATAYASLATLKGMENPRTVEVMLDLTLMKVPAGLSNVLLFGKTGAGWLFDLDTPAAGVSAVTTGLSFKVTRNAAVIATSDASPTLGKRMTIWGRDDQSTVKAISNGASDTIKTYSAAEASYALTTDANPLTLAKSGTNYIAMRLYEAMVRVNGVLVFHVRPKVWMQTGATPTVIPDLSPFGNDLTVVGTLDTDFRYVSAWSKSVAYAGKETVG